MKTWKRILTLLVCSMLALTGWTVGAAAEESLGPLVVEDGMLQPVFNYTDPTSTEYSNEGSDILRFCVWVETDYDTDADGKDDLVKVLVQVPRAAAEGQYKAAVLRRRGVQSKNSGNTFVRIDRKMDYLLYCGKPLKKSEYPFILFRTESR